MLLLVGCTKSEGPPRFDLSGRVTYQGEPVPAGTIRFVPDTSQGNSGPGTSATIENGRYATSSGKGTVGGPHRVTILGGDGVPFETDMPGELDPIGARLFPPKQLTVDLPREAGTYDFELGPQG